MKEIKNAILERKVELLERLSKSKSSVEKRILKAKIDELDLILSFILFKKLLGEVKEAEDDDKEGTQEKDC